MKMKKKGAMEMTMGTMVTIVLLTMVLILGGYFVSKIFTSGMENINSIDQNVKNQINKLFSEDNTKKLVIYPPSRDITIKKGDEGIGFGLSIRNVGDEADKFSYVISAEETSCGMQLSKAEDLIVLNKERNNIAIPAGNVMDDPIFVKFTVPETTPPCKITYTVNMEQGTKPYGSSVDVYVTIKSK